MDFLKDVTDDALDALLRAVKSRHNYLTFYQISSPAILMNALHSLPLSDLDMIVSEIEKQKKHRDQVVANTEQQRIRTDAVKSPEFKRLLEDMRQLEKDLESREVKKTITVTMEVSTKTLRREMGNSLIPYLKKNLKPANHRSLLTYGKAQFKAIHVTQIDKEGRHLTSYDLIDHVTGLLTNNGSNVPGTEAVLPEVKEHAESITKRAADVLERIRHYEGLGISVSDWYKNFCAPTS